ncbi:MAG: hypothetical protein RL199_92 [Pseudomonadota bacterium]|jgi:hypothetical protein
MRNAFSCVSLLALALAAPLSAQAFPSGTVQIDTLTFPDDGTAPVVNQTAARWTNNRKVRLTVTTDGATQYCVKNTDTCRSDGDFHDVNDTDFAATLSEWKLSSGSPASVYAAFRDASTPPNVAHATASIIVDTVLPTQGQLAATGGDEVVHLSWSRMTDSGSGIKEYVIFGGNVATGKSFTAGQLTTPVATVPAPATSLSVKSFLDGTAIVNRGPKDDAYAFAVFARDNAGNLSKGAVASAKPVPERVPPEPDRVLFNVSAVSPDGVTSVRTADVNVTLSATDDNGVSSYCLIEGTAKCTAWRDYTAPSVTTRQLFLSKVEGPHVFRAWFRDTWGNETTVPALGTVVLDTRKPTDGRVSVYPGAGSTLVVDGTLFTDAGSGIGSYNVMVDKVAPRDCLHGAPAATGSTLPLTITALGDGSPLVDRTKYYVRLCAVDRAGNVSSGVTGFGQTKDDITPPEVSAEIDATLGFTSTTSRQVTVRVSMDEEGWFCLSDSAATCNFWEKFDSAAVVAGFVSRTRMVSGGEGLKTIYVRFKDDYDNVAGPVAVTTYLDTTAPVVGGVTALADIGQVQVSWGGVTDALSGVKSVWVTHGKGSAPACANTSGSDETPEGTVVTGLDNGDTYEFRVCAQDFAGNLAWATATAKPVGDFEPPTQLSVYTPPAVGPPAPPSVSAPVVHLKVSAWDAYAITSYCAVEAAACSGSTCAATVCRASDWRDYSAGAIASGNLDIDFTLKGVRGDRMLVVWLRDEWGNVSEPATTTVLFDDVAPVIDGFEAQAGDSLVKLFWPAVTDASSGVAAVWAQDASAGDCKAKWTDPVGSIPGHWGPYDPSLVKASADPLRPLSGPDAPQTVAGVNGTAYEFVLCAVDRAGNLQSRNSNPVSVMPAPEFDAPDELVVTLVDGNGIPTGYSNSLDVRLQLSAVDANVIEMQEIGFGPESPVWQATGLSGTGAQTWQTPTSLAPATADGKQLVYARVRDQYRNVSLRAATEFILDRAAPTISTVSGVPSLGAVTISWAPIYDSLSGLDRVWLLQAASPSVTPTCSLPSQAETVASDLASTGNAAVSGLTDGTDYGFVLCASDLAGNVAQSDLLVLRPALESNPPTDTAVMAIEGRVSVSWTAPATTGGSYIASYRVVATPGGRGCMTVSPGAGTDAPTGCTVSGLTLGTPYSFVVTATNGAGVSAAAAPTGPVQPTLAGLPDAPSGVTVATGAGTATVNWTAPANDGGAPVTQYVVTSSSGRAYTVAAPTATYTFTGLPATNSYTFFVRAVNGMGAGPSASTGSPVTPTPPPAPVVPDAPTSVSAVARHNAALVSWLPPAKDGGSSITTYTVAGAPGGSCTATAPALSCLVTGLTDGTAYTFRVTATNVVGSGLPSNPSASVTPAPSSPDAPTSAGATAGNANADVTWTAPGNDGGAGVLYYLVTSAPEAKTCFAPAGVSTCQVTGLTNGTSYTFTVTATNSAGTSLASAPTPAVTPVDPGTLTAPGAPTAVSAVPGNALADVSWTAPASNGGSTILSYAVLADDGVNPPTLTCTAVFPATTCQVTGLTNGTPYTFTVTATNANGTSVASAPSVAVTPTDGKTVPGAPTSVSAIPVNSAADVTWTSPASDGGDAIIDYTVTASDGTSTCTATAPATSCRVLGLTNSTAYTFTVTARNTKGSGAASTATSAVTPSDIPPPPVMMHADAGDGVADVYWAPYAGVVVEPVVGFIVTSTPGGKTCTVSNPSATTCQVTGLLNDVAYTFTVQAMNQYLVGTASTASAPVTPRLWAHPPTAVIVKPGNGSLDVSWTAPSTGAAPFSYLVTVSTSAGGPALTQNCTALAPATSCTVTGLSNGTTYFVTVTSTSAVGSSSATGSSATPNLATPPLAWPTGVTTVGVSVGMAQQFARVPNLTLRLAASDASQIFDCVTEDASGCADVHNLSSFTPHVATMPFTLSPGDGAKKIYGTYKDVWNNVAPRVWTTVVLDTTAPVDGRVDVLTESSGRVDFHLADFTDALAGIVRYYGIKSSTPTVPSCDPVAADWSAATPGGSFTGLTDGAPYWFRFCAEDAAGNVSPGLVVKATPIPERNAPTAAAIAVDLTDPAFLAGTLPYTTSKQVVLSLSAKDVTSVAQVCLSTALPCLDWRAYDPRNPASGLPDSNSPMTVAWPLVSEGPVTIYATFRDPWGNTSDAVFLNAFRDTVAPTDGVLRVIGKDNALDVTIDGVIDPGNGSGLANHLYTVGVVSGVDATYPAGPAPACDAATSARLYPRAVAPPNVAQVKLTGLKISALYEVRVCAVDRAGNLSAGVAVQAYPVADKTAPAVSGVSVNGMVSSTKVAVAARDITLTISGADNPSGTGLAALCVSRTQSCAAGDWRLLGAQPLGNVPFTSDPVVWTLDDTERSTVYVAFRDVARNVSKWAAVNILLDSVAPTDGSIVVRPDDGSISFDVKGFVDGLSGIDRYLVMASEDGGVPQPCNAASALYNGSDRRFAVASLTNGVDYRFRVCAVDRAGNVSSGVVVAGMPRSEDVPPVVVKATMDDATVTFRGLLPFAGSTSVGLLLAATDPAGPVEACLSNGTECNDWFDVMDSPPGTPRAWTLPSGDGQKRVSVWFRDRWHNLTNVVPVDVTLDTTAPKDGKVTAQVDTKAVHLTTKGFLDATSGVRLLHVLGAPADSADGAPTCRRGAPELASGVGPRIDVPLPSQVGRMAFRVCAEDWAGNWSTGTVINSVAMPEANPPTVDVDANHPTLGVVGGVPVVRTRTVAIEVVNPPVDESEVTHMCFSESTKPCSNWVAYAQTASFILTQIQGQHVVFGWFRDQFGNVSAPASLSVLYDWTAPTNGVLSASAGAVDGSVTLSWRDVIDPETQATVMQPASRGSGLAHYIVRYGRTVAPRCTAGTSAPSCTNLTTGTSSCDIEGLTRGAPIVFRLCAVDVAGNVNNGATAAFTLPLASRSSAMRASPVVRLRPLPTATVSGYRLTDDVVTDTVTGLQWVRHPSTASFDARAAREACPSSYAGLDGWRLPTFDELESLVDPSVKPPLLDRTAFPGASGGAYRSSSRADGKALAVDFDNGAKQRLESWETARVRCVRTLAAP